MVEESALSRVQTPFPPVPNAIDYPIRINLMILWAKFEGKLHYYARKYAIKLIDA